MPKFIVDLSLDGYESEAEEAAACKVFIEEQLDITASCVTVTPFKEESKSLLEACICELEDQVNGADR